MEIYTMTIFKVFFNPTQFKKEKKKKTQKYVRVKEKF